MSKDHERTGIGLAIAVVVLALASFALINPWWNYEESTGRLNAPDGPAGDDGSRRAEIDFYADRWEGQREPASVATAQSALQVLHLSLLVALGSMALYALGQLPGVSRIVNRRASMVLATLATVGLLSALVVAWVWLPQSMAATGVDGPFSARLLDEGYIRTHLEVGWLAACLAAVGATSCTMAAYSAGNADPSVVENFRAVTP